VAVHVKDIAADGPRAERRMVALGLGIVGWDTLLPALRGHCELFIFRTRQSSEYRKHCK